MARAKGRLKASAMAVSIAAHAVVLTALALHAPRLVIPHEEAGPPEPIIPILIMPRLPPAAPGAPPQPIRLHRRHLPHEAPPPDVPLFVAPRETPTPAPPKPRPQAAPRITVQPSPGAQLSAALRSGLVGCANPDLLGPSERERCIERLGRGVGQTPELGPAFSPAKRADFDRAAQAKTHDRQPGMPSGIAEPSADSGASYSNKPLNTPNPAPLRP